MENIVKEKTEQEIEDEKFQLGKLKPKSEDEMTPLEKLIKAQDPDRRIEDEHTEFYYKDSVAMHAKLNFCFAMIIILTLLLIADFIITLILFSMVN